MSSNRINIPAPTRNRVLWTGKPWPAQLVENCGERTLRLCQVTPPLDVEAWIDARAIVFSSPHGELLAAMSGVIAYALSHGLLVFVIAEREQVPNLQTELAALAFSSQVHVWDERGACQLIENCARWDPGRHAGPAKLKGCGKCCEEDRILLRRAFSDCSDVDFRELTTDDRAIFQVTAKLKDSHVGPYPLPFLVKLDRVRRVQIEIGKYESATTHFIPFFARPNLELTRCLLGPTRGLIVANFVENSVALTHEVARGTATPAINSLFEDALRGWRMQAALSEKGEANGKLAPEGAIRTFNDKQRKRLEQRALAAREFGASLTGTAIANIIDNLPPIRYSQAHRHGDLHGDNVQVRDGQAILIDFLQVGFGPLADDPAMLETSLVLSFPAGFTEWQKVATELYEVAELNRVPRPRSHSAPLNSLRDSVRQIRRFALADQLSENEYARAVAVQLLRHGLRSQKRNEDRRRRSYFVFLAERVARSLSGTVPAKRDGSEKLLTSS